MAERPSGGRLSSKFMKSPENLVNTNHDTNVKVEEIRYDHLKVQGAPENKTKAKSRSDDACIPEPISPGVDPRFQQSNTTLRCFVMYTDFYRCEHLLGEGSEACTWFKEVYTSICPNQWITQWDELRARGVLPWHKHKTQGDFPGNKYGVNP